MMKGRGFSTLEDHAMTLNIKDPKAHELAQALAKKRAKP